MFSYSTGTNTKILHRFVCVLFVQTAKGLNGTQYNQLPVFQYAKLFNVASHINTIHNTKLFFAYLQT